MIDQKDAIFFSRKKIVLFSISVIVTIIAIIIAVLEVVKINFSWVLKEIGSSFSDSRWTWLLPLFIVPIYFSLFRFLIYWNWLKKYNLKVKWYKWLFFSFSDRVISIMTPLSLGSYPFQYFWLRNKKIDHFQVVGIITCANFINVFINALVTWPSFVYIAITQYDKIIRLEGGSYCFYLIIVGLLLDLIATLIYFAAGFSRHIHIFFALTINRIAKFLKLKYKTRERIYYEYKQNAIVKKQFIQELKSFTDPSIIVAFTFLFIFIEYNSIFCALQLLGNNTPSGPKLTYMSVINSINVATTANNFIPIPGGEGTTQFSLKIFLKSFLQKNENYDDILNGSITVWRFLTNYLLIFIWLSILPFFLYYCFRKKVNFS